MKMRSFGKLGISGSAFGLGCMRFPMVEKDGKTMDQFRKKVAEGLSFMLYALSRIPSDPIMLTSMPIYCHDVEALLPIFIK